MKGEQKFGVDKTATYGNLNVTDMLVSHERVENIVGK